VDDLYAKAHLVALVSDLNIRRITPASTTRATCQQRTPQDGTTSCGAEPEHSVVDQ
jgi:hypothetical protein